MRALEPVPTDTADARAVLAVVLALHEAQDPRALIGALPRLIAGVIPYDRLDMTGELATHRLTVAPPPVEDHRLAIRPARGGKTLIGVVLGRRRAFTRREAMTAQLLGPHLGAAIDHARLRAALRPGAGSVVVPSVLTDREREVLALVAEGRRDRDIAAALHIERRTVEKHVEHIRGKLGARSRAEAVARWTRATG